MGAPRRCTRSSLSVADGEFIAILGPNGAGKSTLMRAIMGLVANSGEVTFPAACRCRGPRRIACAARGVVLVPEGRGIFAPMTVAENLELGAYLLNDATEFARRSERVFGLFPRLRERLQQTAGSLSGGEQQMLAVGRALMAIPRSCCSTSLRSGSRRRSSRKSSRRSRSSTRRACRSCWSSRRRRWHCGSRSRAYLLSVGRMIAEIDPRTITSHDDLARYYFS